MKLSSGALAAYVAPCVPVAAIGLPVVVYLPPYYAATLGLPLGIVGMIFFLVRVVDVPLDPIFGLLVDRTHGRFGRFRPWLTAGGLVVMLGVYAMFMARPGISAAAAFAGVMITYLGYSAVVVSHTSWGATLSDDYHERSRLFGWWQTANVAGQLLILAVPPLVLGLLPGDGPAVGIHAMGWTILALIPLALALALVGVPERPRIVRPHPRLADLIAVVRLPLLRRLLLVDLLCNLSGGITGAMALFFFEAARGFAPAAASSFLLFYFGAGMLAAPLWVRLARRIGKHRTIAIAALASASVLALAPLLPERQFAVAAVFMAVAGVPAVVPAFLLRAMMADLSDAETLRSGQERTGLFYAALLAVQKLGYAIPVGLSYPVLGLIGFVPRLGPANATLAITGVVLLFVMPSVLLSLTAAWVVRNWPIDAETQARTAAALGG